MSGWGGDEWLGMVHAQAAVESGYSACHRSAAYPSQTCHHPSGLMSYLAPLP